MSTVATHGGSFIGELLARLITDDGRWDRCAWIREPPPDPYAAERVIVDAIALRFPAASAGPQVADRALAACVPGSVVVIEMTSKLSQGLGRLIEGLRGLAGEHRVGIIVASQRRLPRRVVRLGGQHVPVDVVGVIRERARDRRFDDAVIDRATRLLDGRLAALHDLVAAVRWDDEVVVEAVRRARTGRGLLRHVSARLLDDCSSDEREALQMTLRTGYWHPQFSGGSVHAPALQPWLVPLERDWAWMRPVWRHPLESELSRTRPDMNAATLPPRPGPIDQSWRPAVSVRMLGDLVVEVDGRPIKGMRGQLSTSILRYLLARPGRTCPRDELLEVFWPEIDPDRARNRLQVAVSSIRKAFREFCEFDPIEFLDGGYRVSGGFDLWIDLVEFERVVALTRRAEEVGDAQGAVASGRRAVRLYRGDFCADRPYDEWMIVPRERLRMAYENLLDRLADRQFQLGDMDGCIETAERMLEQDPCREDAHRLLMRCYAAQGKSHRAMRQYDACRRVLSAALSAHPSSTTVALYRDIRDQDGDSPP